MNSICLEENHGSGPYVGADTVSDWIDLTCPSLLSEVWTEIIAFSLSYPSLLNLRNVCVHFKSIIDFRKSINHFDVGRCLVSEQVGFSQQVQYIIKECHKSVTGLLFSSARHPSPSLCSAVGEVLSGQKDHLKEIKLTGSPLLVFLSGKVTQCLNLTRLVMVFVTPNSMGQITVDLSSMKMLKQLRGSYVTFKNCRVPLTELACTDVSIDTKDVIRDFQEMLAVCCPTLLILELDRIDLVLKYTDIVELCLPRILVLKANLKYPRHFTGRCIFNITDSFDLHSVSITESNGFALRGFNLLVHCISNITISDKYDGTLRSRLLSNSRLEQFALIQDLTITDVSDEELPEIVSAVAEGRLDHLRRCEITTVDNRGVRSHLNSLADLVLNAPCLENLNISYSARGVYLSRLISLLAEILNNDLYISLRVVHQLSCQGILNCLPVDVTVPRVHLLTISLKMIDMCMDECEKTDDLLCMLLEQYRIKITVM